MIWLINVLINMLLKAYHGTQTLNFIECSSGLSIQYNKQNQKELFLQDVPAHNFFFLLLPVHTKKQTRHLNSK